MRIKGVKAVLAMAAGAALALATAGPASAVSFTFTHEGGFVLGSQTQSGGNGGVEFFGPTGTVPNTYKEIGWGCTVGGGNCAQSGLVVPDSPVTGVNKNSRSAMNIDVFSSPPSAEVGGDWVDITALRHFNRVIDGNSSFLTSIRIDTVLTINVNPAVADPGSSKLSFKETLNSGSCPDGNPAKSICDDFFSFDPGDLSDLIIHDNTTGKDYRAEFRVIIPDQIDLNNDGIGDGANGAAFDPAHPDRVYTAENAISEARVQMRLVEIVVPAPAALLLVGVGLLGAAVANRRKAS